MPLKDRIAVRSRSIALLFGGIALALLAVLAVLQVRDMRADRDTIAMIETGDAQLANVNDFLSLLQDVETGTRGYVATGNADFLQPMMAASTRLPALGQTLTRDHSGDPKAAAMVRELLAVSAAKVANSRHQQFVRRTEGREAAELIIASGHGKRLMDRARVLVKQLADIEREQMRQALVSVSDERATRQAQHFLIQVAIVLALGALFATMAWMIRSLDRSSRLLSDSARRQSAVFEGASDSMMVLDTSGRIESMNASAEHLYGRHRSDLVGTSSFDLFANPPTLEEGKAYLRALERGDERVQTTAHFTGRRGDGTIFETEVAMTAIRLHDGLHFLAVARDITERLRIERMKTEFVATVSHELRTPLTSIAGSLGLLASGAAGVLPDKAARLTSIAHSNSQRLIRLVNDILDIEKMEAGKMAFEPTVIVLDDFLPRVIEASSGMASERQVSLSLHAEAPDGALIADSDRLMQVFANLLSNAIKYSPEGGTVEIRSRPLGRMWRVSVSDRGPGIPPEFRERMFEKFSQADSTDTRRVGGTGLGLAIVREIVARSNGAISFDTQEGRGTTFHVDLPAAALPVPTIDPSHLSRPPGDAMFRILHVDDDGDTLRLVRAAIDDDIAITPAETLADARALVGRYAYDLVVLDLTMIDGNGASLVPEIRAAAPDSAIVLFTAYDVEAGLGASVDAVLTKSRVELHQLEATIRSLLAERQPQGDAA